jgi:AsmA family
MTNEASPEAYATEPASTAPPSHSADEPVISPVRPTRWKRRITIVSIIVIILAAAVVIPPFINISRYQRQVTGVVSRALGRPVRLKSVELRLLPRPGFVLRDLSVSENPAFGAEPILSASTVVASIRILSLWRGHVEIDRISVDEASLNLVRSAQGMWNLQSIMTGGLGINGSSLGGSGSASGNPSAGTSSGRPRVLPYLEATNSRVNLKNGLEKSPFSLTNTQLSLWQDSPGAWRLRLRGQPVRTDMQISMADTGEVRVEASLQTSNPSHEMRDMPLKLQAEWRDAQLGQLSRLLFGSDAGWRGDLTADMDVQGTPDAAQTKTRLRATGVRREEFAPETPLDFDANCSFLYQHSQQAVHNLGCDTAIGSGQLHLKADLPGSSGTPQAMLEITQLPLQAGLDLLRTVRSGFAPGMSAQGSATGSLSLTPAAANTTHSAPPRSSSHNRKNQPAQPAPGSLGLQGSLVVSGGVLKGGSLKQPITLPKMTLTPVQIPVQAPAQNPDQTHGNLTNIGLNSRFTIALGPEPVTAPVTAPVASPAVSPAPAPASTSAATDATPQPAPRTHATSPTPAARPQELIVRLLLTEAGYNATVGGTASIAKLRELAYDFGAPHQEAADRFSAGTADVDLAATGPWIPSSNIAIAVPATPAPVQPTQTTRASTVAASLPAAADGLAGSLQLHRAEWQAPYLARPVELPQGNIALTASSVTLTSDFTYGALKGSLTGSLPANIPPSTSAGTIPCDASTCPPQLQIRLGAVEAKDIQEALLGAPEKRTLLSPLIDKMRSSDHPKWPPVTVRVQSDSLVLGPATLTKPTLLLKLTDSEIVLQSWEAGILGGSANGTGRCAWDASNLKYTLEGQFTKISPAQLGTLLNSTAATSDADTDSEPATAGAWSGGPLNGSGSLQISGLNSKELAASATGAVHFSWPRGSIPIAATAHDDATASTPAETRFDAWDGTTTLAAGKAQLAANVMHQGKHTSSVTGTLPFGRPPHLTLGPANPKPAPEAPAQPASANPKVQ